MEPVLHFMGNHPFLTFFLALIIVNGAVRLVRGYPKCSECGETRDDD